MLFEYNLAIIGVHMYGAKIVNFVQKSFNQISKIDQFKITNCSSEDQVQSQSSVHTSLGRTVSFST